MDLIVTHVNADFDGFASLVAAKKLYPNSHLLMPGSQEKAVREFLALTKGNLRFQTEKDCSLEGIDRLIIVDTRHTSRIGIAQQLVDKGVELHIYDHHPRTKDDVPADRDVYLEVGATVTILVDIIKTKKIKLSILEATLMLLGIYEETGSLTFRSTTKMDVDMVSFLLSQGASLAVVSSYLNMELSEEDLSFFMKLINATERVAVKGISVSFAEVASEDFAGEIGALVHKLMEIENIPVLFVFVKTPGNRINLIARSNVQDVDVNRVLSHFGGGGHPAASYAKLKTGDVKDLKESIIKMLKSSIRIRIYAQDMMRAHPLTVNINDSLVKAESILSKMSSDAALVKSNEKVVGVITMSHIARAKRHGFGHSRVKGYMSTAVATVAPKTPLYVIKRLILERDSAIIPVVKGRRLVGAIDRTDVMKRVYNDMFTKRRSVEKQVVKSLSKKMENILPKAIFVLLKRIGRLANKNGCSAFIVGGLVRDLVMGRRNIDLDIVIEGDAINFAGILARDLMGTLVVHRRFGTASVFSKDKLKIDIATARKEVYGKPAALPTVVEFGSLKNDLIRRDFTVNAMAVSLNRENFGQLVDFFGGESDLRGGKIKVLHDSSFIDDPTRIFRAVRFEQRFGFKIDEHTEELIKYAIRQEMFDKTEKQRIRDELILVLKEQNPVKALRRMDDLHELAFIHPHIKFSKRMEVFFKSIWEVLAWYNGSAFRKRAVDEWLLYLMALVDGLSYDELHELCETFAFASRDRMRLESFKKRSRNALKILAKRGDVAPSRIYALLEPLAYEVILAIMAKTDSESTKLRIREFFTRYNGTRVRVHGRDLKALGLEPSPAFKRILTKILYRKVDGYLKTKTDELEYAKRLIASLER